MPLMDTDGAGTLVFPIGHCIGTYYDLPVSMDHFHQVRVGPDAVRLSDEQFAVWGLAHGTPDREPDRPWDRQAVVDTARRVGVTDPETVFAGLLDDGLLATTVPGSEAAVDFARRYRLVPLMLGLGNSSEEPRLYAVGLPGRPLVQMMSSVYDLYEWAHMERDLWAACRAAAETAGRVDITDPAATDPARLLDVLLAALHTLLGPNAVHLDTRRAG